MKVQVIIKRGKDGRFTATCPTLPGCISEGDTREAALANIRDAAAGYIASLKKHGEDGPDAGKLAPLL